MIIGSPFRVPVIDRLDANRVNVKMSPAMRANVLQEVLIDGQTAGPGFPSVNITDIHGKFSRFDHLGISYNKASEFLYLHELMNDTFVH